MATYKVECDNCAKEYLDNCFRITDYVEACDYCKSDKCENCKHDHAGCKDEE